MGGTEVSSGLEAYLYLLSYLRTYLNTVDRRVEWVRAESPALSVQRRELAWGQPLIAWGCSRSLRGAAAADCVGLQPLIAWGCRLELHLDDQCGGGAVCRRSFEAEEAAAAQTGGGSRRLPSGRSLARGGRQRRAKAGDGRRWLVKAGGGRSGGGPEALRWLAGPRDGVCEHGGGDGELHLTQVADGHRVGTTCLYTCMCVRWRRSVAPRLPKGVGRST